MEESGEKRKLYLLASLESQVLTPAEVKVARVLPSNANDILNWYMVILFRPNFWKRKKGLWSFTVRCARRYWVVGWGDIGRWRWTSEQEKKSLLRITKHILWIRMYKSLLPRSFHPICWLVRAVLLLCVNNIPSPNSPCLNTCIHLLALLHLPCSHQKKPKVFLANFLLFLVRFLALFSSFTVQDVILIFY